MSVAPTRKPLTPEQKEVLRSVKLLQMGISTIRQKIAIQSIGAEPGIGSTELGPLIFTSRSTAAESCKQLRHKGFIEVRYDKESKTRKGFRVSYYLTEIGREAVALIMEGRAS